MPARPPGATERSARAPELLLLCSAAGSVPQRRTLQIPQQPPRGHRALADIKKNKNNPKGGRKGGQETKRTWGCGWEEGPSRQSSHEAGSTWGWGCSADFFSGVTANRMTGVVTALQNRKAQREHSTDNTEHCAPCKSSEKEETSRMKPQQFMKTHRDRDFGSPILCASKWLGVRRGQSPPEQCPHQRHLTAKRRTPRPHHPTYIAFRRIFTNIDHILGHKNKQREI